MIIPFQCGIIFQNKRVMCWKRYDCPMKIEHRRKWNCFLHIYIYLLCDAIEMTMKMSDGVPLFLARSCTDMQYIHSHFLGLSCHGNPPFSGRSEKGARVCLYCDISSCRRASTAFAATATTQWLLLCIYKYYMYTRIRWSACSRSIVARRGTSHTAKNLLRRTNLRRRWEELFVFVLWQHFLYLSIMEFNTCLQLARWFDDCRCLSAWSYWWWWSTLMLWLRRHFIGCMDIEFFR